MPMRTCLLVLQILRVPVPLNRPEIRGPWPLESGKRFEHNAYALSVNSPKQSAATNGRLPRFYFQHLKTVKNHP
jgi:hypothetical protein